MKAGLPSVLVEPCTSSSNSQLSEKHDSSSEEVPKEEERTITGIKFQRLFLRSLTKLSEFRGCPSGTAPSILFKLTHFLG
ncbi:Phomenoic acid biosynthesis cluster MFS-type transporter [Penicillium diatomitis]|uniref:Phomenoic acid biosynthesis cluster MFS-type transporter n=1 Tax=Penicillium diatomitis TaxID=2819901 RepID=A0A9W9XMV5_9EURO|nr:Phomenoic acid biosynthesis cluster MFS-type transporter [Penicillium diatomitis]KAJ5495495.1 Phomenoic acid biosynthesis cluster MFS-type transporter [Penicillium diatomitis]